jgi:hypothetical protein
MSKYKRKTENDPSRNKDGRLTEKDMKYLRENYDKYDHLDLAEKLKRNPETIKKVLKKIIAEDNVRGATKGLLSAHDLRSQAFWGQLKKQFSNDELKVFEANWNGIIAEQFKEDILYTEKLQLKALLETQIFLDRNGEEKMKAAKDRERLEELIEEFYRTPKEQRTDKWQDDVFNLEQQLQFVRDSSKANTDEQTKLQSTSAKLTSELKGSRKDRVEKATEGSLGWTDLLRRLEDEEFRNRATRQGRLLDMASEKSKDKLSDYHKYMDDTLDRPILNSETVKKEEEEDDDEE